MCGEVQFAEKCPSAKKPSFRNKRILTFLERTIYNSTLVLHMYKAPFLTGWLVRMRERTVVSDVKGILDGTGQVADGRYV